jgi:hypothetical protein
MENELFKEAGYDLLGYKLTSDGCWGVMIILL